MSSSIQSLHPEFHLSAPKPLRPVKPRGVNRFEHYFRNLVLCDFSGTATKESLYREMVKFGEINEISLYFDDITGLLNYALIEFAKRSDCLKTFHYYNDDNYSSEVIPEVHKPFHVSWGPTHEDLIDFHAGKLSHLGPDLDINNPAHFIQALNLKNSQSQPFISLATTPHSTSYYQVAPLVNNIRSIMINSLGSIPVIGGLMVGVYSILWPEMDSEDVWDAIEERAEALIDKKLDQHVYDTTNATLQGLSNVLQNYIQFVTDPSSSPQQKFSVFQSTKAFFEHDEPQFMVKGSEILLLPLFAQFANLFMTLLKDALDFGPGYGLSPSMVQSIASELDQKATQYQQWAQSWSNSIISAQKGWADKNRVTREFTIGVLDYAQLWPYFNSIKYPGIQNPSRFITREIFSDILGASAGSDFSDPYKTSFATGLPRGFNGAVKNYNLTYNASTDNKIVKYIQVFYNDNQGPGGQSTSGIMGDSINYSTNIMEYDNLSNPIVSINVRAGNALYQLAIPNFHAPGGPGQTIPQQGSMFGSLNPNSGVYSQLNYQDHVVTSIHIYGTTYVDHVKGCKNILVGFRLKSSLE